VVIELRTKPGATVKLGEALVVLSAMKMETVVGAPLAGVIRRVVVVAGDSLAAGDLLVEIEPADDDA
jgi:pyruvate carboxylase